MGDKFKKHERIVFNGMKELESGILPFTDDLSKLREKMTINGD